MKEKTPVVFCAFANDPVLSLKLSEEEKGIRTAFSRLHHSGKIEFFSLGMTSIDQLYDQLSLYGKRVSVFHFGGHSSSDEIKLVDGESKMDNLAVELGQQAHLSLVFLNGCQNVNQIKALFREGIPAVIATSTEVGDDVALVFATKFYHNLVAGKSIRQAFDSSSSLIKDLNSNVRIVSNERTPVSQSTLEPLGKNIYGLYCLEDEALNWTIPNGKRSNKKWSALSWGVVFILVLGGSLFWLSPNLVGEADQEEVIPYREDSTEQEVVTIPIPEDTLPLPPVIPSIDYSYSIRIKGTPEVLSNSEFPAFKKEVARIISRKVGSSHSRLRFDRMAARSISIEIPDVLLQPTATEGDLYAFRHGKVNLLINGDYCTAFAIEGRRHPWQRKEITIKELLHEIQAKLSKNITNLSKTTRQCLEDTI